MQLKCFIYQLEWWIPRCSLYMYMSKMLHQEIKGSRLTIFQRILNDKILVIKERNNSHNLRNSMIYNNISSGY